LFIYEKELSGQRGAEWSRKVKTPFCGFDVLGLVWKKAGSEIEAYFIS